MGYIEVLIIPASVKNFNNLSNFCGPVFISIAPSDLCLIYRKKISSDLFHVEIIKWQLEESFVSTFYCRMRNQKMSFLKIWLFLFPFSFILQIGSGSSKNIIFSSHDERSSEEVSSKTRYSKRDSGILLNNGEAKMTIVIF